MSSAPKTHVTTAMLQTVRQALLDVLPAIEALLRDELDAAYQRGFRDGADLHPNKED